MEDSDQQKQLSASQETKQSHQPLWKTLGWLVWDFVFALVKGAAIGKHIRDVELQHIKKVPVLLICALVLGVIGGCWMRGSVAKKNETTLVTNYSITNSRLAGALTENSNQNQRMEQQLDKNQRDHSAQLLQLTLDCQEAKREKDVEILKVTEERDAARHDLAQFQAIPSNFMTIYTDLTNAAKLFVQDPQTTRQLGRIESLTTNLLSSMQQPSPKFNVSLDGVMLADTLAETNGPIVVHPMKPGNIEIKVRNIGSLTAEHLNVDVQVPLDSTNVAASGWHLQANGSGTFVLFNQTNDFPILGHWKVEAEHSIANEESFVAPSFTILTNASGRLVPLCVDVHADRTKLQRFKMTLLILPGG